MGCDLHSPRKISNFALHMYKHLQSGVGLRFIRELEQGKETLRMDKVNQVLSLFGAELGPTEGDRS